MEETFLMIKFALFVVLEFAVLALIGAVLIAAIYQIVREKVLESRRQDEIALETGPTVWTGPNQP